MAGPVGVHAKKWAQISSHRPERINILIYTLLVYLVNIHSKGKRYAIRMAPNPGSTTSKSAIESLGCFCTCHFILKVILVPFLFSFSFPLSPSLRTWNCCFSFSMDFPWPEGQAHSGHPASLNETNVSKSSSGLMLGLLLLIYFSPTPTWVCPSGPTTVCYQWVSGILFLPPYLASLIYQDVLIRRMIHSYPASAHTMPHIRKPSIFPDTSLKPTRLWSPGLCSLLLGEASPTHPSSLEFVHLWSSSFFWLFM